MAVQDLQQVLGYLYAERIRTELNSLVKEYCVGCQYDHPAQKHHACMNPKPDPDFVTPVLYEIAAGRVNKFDLKLLFIETTKNLFMDYTAIDFKQYLKDLEHIWRHTEWSNIAESSKVPEYIELAVLSARMKLIVLEKIVHP